MKGTEPNKDLLSCFAGGAPPPRPLPRFELTCVRYVWLLARSIATLASYPNEKVQRRTPPLSQSEKAQNRKYVKCTEPNKDLLSCFAEEGPPPSFRTHMRALRLPAFAFHRHPRLVTK